MIRIKDIAEMAGVSPTTVSNVIHGNTKKVSKEKIRIIEELLRRENYVPSLSARMLAGMDSGIAGVITGPDTDSSGRGISDPFLGEILSAVEKALYDNGMYMIFHQAASPGDIGRLAAGWKVEGVITIGLDQAQNLALLGTMEVPCVSVDVYYDGKGLPNVGLDDFGGGRLMAEHLLNRGCRRLAFLADNDEGVDHMRRLGILKAMEDSGRDVSLSSLLLPHGRLVRERWYESGGMQELLKADALFYSSDYYACEGLQKLREHGISAPEDILVGGFDDSFLAVLQTPKLTTVHQDISLKGETAVRKLLELVRGEKNVVTDTRLPVRLVVRESA